MCLNAAPCVWLLVSRLHLEASYFTDLWGKSENYLCCNCSWASIFSIPPPTPTKKKKTHPLTEVSCCLLLLECLSDCRPWPWTGCNNDEKMKAQAAHSQAALLGGAGLWNGLIMESRCAAAAAQAQDSASQSESSTQWEGRLTTASQTALCVSVCLHV